MSIFEVLDRIKPNLPAPLTPTQPTAGSQPPAPQLRAQARSLVIDAPDNRRTVITVPVESAGLDFEKFITRIRGRLVGAEEANRNNQFWSTGDLVFGVGSVAGGPLNWLHEEKHIVGAITDARLINGPHHQQTAGQQQPHIEAESVLWSFLYPNETAMVREAAGGGSLFYSMECVSREVECFGPTGCGRVMAYADTVQRNDKACEHVRDRSGVRRLINPVFLGAAVIVPPIRPGWANAHADIVARAAASEALQEFTDGHTELAAQILSFVAGS